SETLKIIESLLNESDDEELRANAIYLIEKLSIFNEKASKLIEKSIITDESPLVRVNAAKIALKNNLDQTETALNWSIENEKSILFFKKILDFTAQSQNPNTLQFHEKILEKLEKIYNLNKHDSKFILDLDYIEYERFLKDFRVFLSKFKIEEVERKKLFKENTEIGFKGLGRIKSIKKKYITGLVLNNLESIPKSLQYLSKLESLEIRSSNIGFLPDKYGHLSNLKYLILKNNQIEVIPSWVLSIASKDYYIKKYIKNGVKIEEAPILGLLEILTGQAFIKLEIENTSSHSLLFYYKTNENGNIITLYLSSELSRIGVFPKEICKLKFLVELCMVNQNIKIIPDCIRELTNLKILNLNFNPIKEIPASIGTLENVEYLYFKQDEGKLDSIPEDLIKLRNLKVLDLTGNIIEHIPESIKSLKSMKL
ncbi:MAG: leucine-rich repeat domain-containing protein, partial [Promethearchaeota archaeon]